MPDKFNLMQKITKLFTNKSFVVGAWFVLSLLPVLKGVLMPHIIDVHIGNANINNYIIYKHNFLNLIQQHSLFGSQPEYYFDLNHYGPVFALVIAPFTIFPDSIGAILWVMFNSWILYLAVMKLPLNDKQKVVILLISLFS